MHAGHTAAPINGRFRERGKTSRRSEMGARCCLSAADLISVNTGAATQSWKLSLIEETLEYCSGSMPNGRNRHHRPSLHRGLIASRYEADSKPACPHPNRDDLDVVQKTLPAPPYMPARFSRRRCWRRRRAGCESALRRDPLEICCFSGLARRSASRPHAVLQHNSTKPRKDGVFCR